MSHSSIYLPSPPLPLPSSLLQVPRSFPQEGAEEEGGAEGGGVAGGGEEVGGGGEEVMSLMR